MSILKRRLTDLWSRQTTAPNPPRPWPNQCPDRRMLVTISEPMKISGTVLLPGRYVFLLLDPRAERNLVQIFNEDQTRLIATITTVLSN
jgi:hypothetical protein